MTRLGGRTPGPLISRPAWVYVEQIALLADEVPLFAWDAAVPGRWQTLGWGTLYVTNQRLVWIRWRTSFSWIANLVEIPISSVTAIETRRTWSRILFGPQLVIAVEGAEPCVFVPGTFAPNARRMMNELSNILRERGLLRD